MKPSEKYIYSNMIVNQLIIFCCCSFVFSLNMGFVPASSTAFNAEVAQLVEHNLAKVRVAGSSPVFRSCFQIKPRNSSELRGFLFSTLGMSIS